MDAILGLLAKAIIPLKKENESSGQAMANLQISWLKDLQAYNTRRDDLAVWCSRVEELLPPKTPPEDALRLVMTKLPHNLSETPKSCVIHVKGEGNLTWRRCVDLFLFRVKGKEGEMAQEKRMQSIRQR